MKKIVQALIIILMLMHLYSEEMNFDLNDYDLSNADRSVSSKVNSYKSFNFSGLSMPVVFKELRFIGQYAEEIKINSFRFILVKADLKLAFYDEGSDPAGINHPYQPVTLGARGVKRHGGFSVLDINPFFVHNDSLFFITSFDYSIQEFRICQALQPSKIQNYDKIDIAVITAEKYTDNFEKYKIFKTKQGFKTVIKTVEEIYGEYQGENDFIKIRNYVRDMYIQNDLEFVIIGGGYKVIPTGKALPYISPETSFIETDAVYSCLDGEPDSNANGIYFESEDKPDYYPDVYVGRFPGNSDIEIDAVINKTITYYSFSRSFRDGFNTSLFLAGFNVNMVGDGMLYCENVRSEFSDIFTADSMYEGVTYDFTHQNMMSKFNRGYNFVYSQSHGDVHLIRQIDNDFKIWSDQIYATEALSGLYFIAACEPGNIGKDSFSRKAMVSPEGGCVNYIGSGGAELPAISNYANGYFFKGIFENKSIGESLANSIIVYGNIAYNGYEKYMALAYVIQGDPSNKPFINEPETVYLSSIGLFKRGNGTVSGYLNTTSSDTVYITVTADDRIISKTKTTDTNFKITYDNLNADTVSVNYYSQSIFLRTYDYRTVPADDIEFQISGMRPDDRNESGIIEHGENFGLKFDFKTRSNTLGIDSLVARITKISNSEISIQSGKAKFKVPEPGSSIALNLFDMIYFSENPFEPDSVAVIDFEIQKTDGKVLYSQKLFVPTAVPHLILQSVKWSVNTVKPKFLNASKGVINSVKIELLKAKKTADTDIDYPITLNNSITLKNIGGYEIVSDSVSFKTDTAESYRFSIKVNNDKTYFSNEFSLNYDLIEKIKLYADHSSGRVNLEWSHIYNGVKMYNVYSSNTADFAVKEQRNFDKLTLSQFSFDHNSYAPVFVYVAFIDPEGSENFISNIVKIEPIPLYGNTTYKLAPFQLYNPSFIDGKLISNSQNSSIAGLNQDGTLINGSGLIHTAGLNGFSGSGQQGYAVGDIDGDGSNDAVNYSYSTGDSVLVKIVNLTSGTIIAQRKIYGFIMENAPVLVNADEDPQLEILISVFNGNINGSPKGSFVYMLDLDGSNLVIADGFPIFSSYSSYNVHSPSLLDLNNDGSKELIFDCGPRIVIYNFSDMTKIIDYALPKTIQTSLSFCDMNQDGNIEIFVLTESYGSYGKLFCYNFNGKTLIERSETTGGLNVDMKAGSFYDLTPPVSFADIDDNGTIEIIVLTASKLYIYNDHFYDFQNYPVTLDKRVTKNNLSAPSIADFDGDGCLDILFMDQNYRVWCYSGISGRSLPGFPIQIFDIKRFEMTAPAVADLDGDSTLEFAVGVNDGVMVVYDYPHQTSGKLIFDKFRGDSYNSGLFQPIAPSVPENIMISFEGSDLKISWSPVLNAASYRIYSSDSPFGDFTYLCETKGTNYLISDKSEKKRFYYITAVK